MRVTDQWLTIYGAANDLGVTRLGIAISRHFGNAVQRNRRKRLVREAFRRVRHQLPSGFDLVAVVRDNRGAEPSIQGLEDSILHLADRLATEMQRRQSRRRTPGS